MYGYTFRCRPSAVSECADSVDPSGPSITREMDCIIYVAKESCHAAHVQALSTEFTK